MIANQNWPGYRGRAPDGLEKIADINLDAIRAIDDLDRGIRPHRQGINNLEVLNKHKFSSRVWYPHCSLILITFLRCISYFQILPFSSGTKRSTHKQTLQKLFYLRLIKYTLKIF